jgi:hypothetical protein
MIRAAATLLGIVVVCGGCHAPVPNVREAFSATGSTRIAAPSTFSFTAANPYYPNGAAATSAAAPSASPTIPLAPAGVTSGLRLPPAQPYTTGPSATPPNLPTTLTPPPPVNGGAAWTPPAAAAQPSRVRISANAARSSYNAPADGVAGTANAEPSPFVPPTGIIPLSQLANGGPPATASPAPVAAASPAPVAAGNYAPLPRSQSDAAMWHSRQ